MMVQKLEKSVDNYLNKSYRMGVLCSYMNCNQHGTTKRHRQPLYYVKNVDIDSDNVMDRRILPQHIHQHATELYSGWIKFHP
jgi:hypothetical protein